MAGWGQPGAQGHHDPAAGTFEASGRPRVTYDQPQFVHGGSALGPSAAYLPSGAWGYGPMPQAYLHNPYQHPGMGQVPSGFQYPPQFGAAGQMYHPGHARSGWKPTGRPEPPANHVSAAGGRGHGPFSPSGPPGGPRIESAGEKRARIQAGIVEEYHRLNANAKSFSMPSTWDATFVDQQVQLAHQLNNVVATQDAGTTQSRLLSDQLAENGIGEVERAHGLPEDSVEFLFPAFFGSIPSGHTRFFDVVGLADFGFKNGASGKNVERNWKEARAWAVALDLICQGNVLGFLEVAARRCLVLQEHNAIVPNPKDNHAQRDAWLQAEMLESSMVSGKKNVIPAKLRKRHEATMRRLQGARKGGGGKNAALDDQAY